MEKVFVFFLGMAEFRSAYTTHYESLDLHRAYELGRDFAHRCTFRYFEG